MSWERDPLLAKARWFFERAFDEERDEPLFGLWCSLGLELVARAAVASVSPALLAEPDPEHNNLLHALNRGSGKRKSIGTVKVLNLCRRLFDSFSEDDYRTVLALTNRRNDELHSGAAAFDEYPSSQWLLGFYRACRSLTAAMGESLESLFGPDEASVAGSVLDQDRTKVTDRVLKAIGEHRSAFSKRTFAEKEAAANEAAERGERLAFERHHRVTCPACQCAATVEGDTFGPQRVSADEGAIEVRQSVSPHSFCCSACGLTLAGYAELEAAELGGHYTRTTTYSPEEYYGLVDPDTFDPAEYFKEDFGSDYDNE